MPDGFEGVGCDFVWRDDRQRYLIQGFLFLRERKNVKAGENHLSY